MAKPDVMQPSAVPTGICGDMPMVGATVKMSIPTLSPTRDGTGPRQRKRARVDEPRAEATDTADATGAATSVPRRKLRFEDLPPETRSMVYEQLLVRDDAIRPLCHDDRHMEPPGTGRPPGLGNVISLLRVSRLVHAEAAEILYGRNAFLLYALDFGDAVLGFLRKIGRTNRRSIRRLELDWQHGITNANRASKANDLFAMVDDLNNPLRKDVARMLHDVNRNTIAKFVAALELLVGSPRLERLTILCPSSDNPGHPDNHCVEVQGCTGCQTEVPRALAKIEGVKCLTVGYTDRRNELEAVAREMGVRELNVVQIDCIELSQEALAELKQHGWTISISWRDSHGEDFRRVTTKHFSVGNTGGRNKRKRW